MTLPGKLIRADLRVGSAEAGVHNTPAMRRARTHLDVARSALYAALVALVFTAGLGAAETPPLPTRGICAHRGGGTAFPENTVPALREAVRLGAQMIEFDLALTRDGELVLMHDATVDRTTNGKGRVIDLTLADVKKLDAGAWKAPRFAGTRVPTFDEALEALPRNVWLNIDLKADARFGKDIVPVLRRIVQRLAETGRRHQAVLAVRAEAAAAVGRLPHAPRICSMDRQRDPADYVRDAIARKVDFIQLRDCASDPRLAGWIRDLKAAGIRTNYFYANDPTDVARLLTAGIDFVLVDDLERVRPSLFSSTP